jgi:transposase
VTEEETPATGADDRRPERWRREGAELAAEIGAAPAHDLYRLACVDISGDLSLAHRELPKHLVFESCHFEGDVSMSDADGHLVEFRECRLLNGIDADRLRADTLVVSKCVAGSTLHLSAAHLGRLELDGTRVTLSEKDLAQGEVAVDANVLTTSRSVTLRNGFSALGRVRFIGASVGGQLSFSKARLEVTGEPSALSLHELTTGRSVYLREATIVGGVNFSGANVGGRVDAREVTIDATARPNGMALDLSGTTVARALQLLKARVRGAVRGKRLRVGTLVSLVDARIEALAPVAGPKQLREPDASDGRCRSLGHEPADRAGVGLRLEGLTCSDANLSCITLIGRNGIVDSHINGSMDALGLVLARNDEPGTTELPTSLALSGTSVSGALRWREVGKAEADLDFRHLTVDRLDDDPTSWEAAPLDLSGVRYRWLPLETDGWTIEKRLTWLDRPKVYDRGLYDQLETLLRQQGRTADARRVARQREGRRRVDLASGRNRAFGWLLGVVTGFGYAPERALGLLVALVLAGWLMFAAAWNADAITPDEPCPADSACFNALLLSADVALPIVDLGYDGDWKVNRQGNYGRWFVWGHAIEVAAGWTLATLVVAGLTRRAIRE